MATARTSILDVLDPARIVHSGDPPKTPGYVNQAGQYNANNAQYLGNQGNAMLPWFQGVQHGAAALRPMDNRYLTAAGAYGEQAATGATGNILLRDPRAQLAAAGTANAGVQGTLDRQRDVANRAGYDMNAQLANSRQDLNVIRDSALGRGPSAAQHLAQAQLDQNVRAQGALAAGARGGNLASAQRSAALGGAQQMLQSQQQMAALRAQEQLNAQSLLNQGNAALMTGQNQVGQIQNAAALGLTAGQQNNANQFGALANTGTAQAGVGAEVIGQGLTSMGNTAANYGNQAAAAQAADLAARQAYMDWLQRQYGISVGVPVQAGGVVGTQGMAGYQSQVAQGGANASLVGGLLGGLLNNDNNSGNGNQKAGGAVVGALL